MAKSVKTLAAPAKTAAGSRRRTAGTKPATPAKSEAIPAAPPPAAELPEPVIATASPAPRMAAPQLRKKELVARVTAASGAKKKDAKAVVEATLAVLGEALAQGEDLNLPPLGRARVSRRKETAAGTVLTLQLRRGTAGAESAEGEAEGDAAGEKDTKEPLAEPAE